MARKIVTVITPHYSPEITAASHRMEAAVKKLSSAYSVHVVALAERGSDILDHSIKCEENLTIHYVSVSSYDKSAFLSRAYNEWKYSMKLVRKANTIDSDLVIVTSPFMFLLPVVARFSKAKKKIADVRDLVWHYLPTSSFIKRITKKKISNLMHRSLNKFDAITVSNQSEKNWLMAYAFLSENKISVIRNGISKDKFNQLSKIKYAPHPQKFTIAYVGNVGNSQNFLSVIEAVKDMKDVRLNIVGDGNKLSQLRGCLAANNIQNVFLAGKQKWMRAMPFYQTADVLFASLKDEYDTAIPSKLYEYLATGLPVLYQGNGEAAAFLSKFKNTFIVADDSVQELEKAIWKIKKAMPDQSEKNVNTIENYFIREKLSERFVEIAARLLNKKELSDVYVEDILFSTNY